MFAFNFCIVTLYFSLLKDFKTDYIYEMSLKSRMKNRLAFQVLENSIFARRPYYCVSPLLWKIFLIPHLTFRQKYTHCPSSQHARVSLANVRQARSDLERDKFIRIHDNVQLLFLPMPCVFKRSNSFFFILFPVLYFSPNRNKEKISSDLSKFIKSFRLS